MNDMTDEEKQLVEWLADMNEDDALALANRNTPALTVVVPV